MKWLALLCLLKVVVSCSNLESTTNVNVDRPKYAVVKDQATGEEFHTGLRHKPDNLQGLGEMHMKLEGCENLPDSFDLRTVGTVPPIKNQGQCGSCWSFSKTGSLESALLASGKSYMDLSEQELVSNDKSQWGCDGGLLSDFKYQIDHGQGLESDFPYTSGSTGRTGSAKNIPVAAKGISFAYIGAPNRGPTEEELKCALYKTKTIPWITTNASNWGSVPKSEKTPYTRCSRMQTNHAVGVVGWYKDNNGKTQFIMKNSWGTSWGDKGYMSLSLGCDNFGEEAAYIVTESTPCKPPVVKLPAEVSAMPGVEVLVGVKDNTITNGWTYDWYVATQKIGSGPHLYVTPEVDTVYKLVARSKCGTAESSVRIKIIQAQ